MNEHQKMLNIADMVEGAINRICVSHDLMEVDRMAYSAKINIGKLVAMRYKELKHGKAGDTDAT